MTKWRISDFGLVSDFDIRISSLWNVFGITIAKEEWCFEKKSGKLAEQLTHFKKIMIGISFFGKVFGPGRSKENDGTILLIFYHHRI